MTDVQARIHSVAYSESGEMLVTFAVDKSFKREVTNYRDKDLKLVVGRYTKHRSLSANA